MAGSPTSLSSLSPAQRAEADWLDSFDEELEMELDDARSPLVDRRWRRKKAGAPELYSA
ncbi:hypothetical protein PT7_2247 [Pusillimonas sp. T7-7]|nr:hypothetical protein PT7_2247 [Pusillimonas sp. T7-7]